MKIIYLTKKVIILGGGPNRIGQGIDLIIVVFMLYSLSEEKLGFMINCNPETVSLTDTSDKLYFEPLTFEDVLEIVKVEMSRESS